MVLICAMLLFTPRRESRHPPAGSTTGFRLVLLAEVLLLAFALGGFGTDLLVVLLEGGKVLTGLGELALLHALADVPVDERTLGVPGGTSMSARGEGGSDVRTRV